MILGNLSITLIPKWFIEIVVLGMSVPITAVISWDCPACWFNDIHGLSGSMGRREEREAIRGGLLQQ